MRYMEKLENPMPNLDRYSWSGLAVHGDFPLGRPRFVHLGFASLCTYLALPY